MRSWAARSASKARPSSSSPTTRSTSCSQCHILYIATFSALDVFLFLRLSSYLSRDLHAHCAQGACMARADGVTAAACSQLQEEVELVKKENRRLQGELDERKLDVDKFKALQSHSTHQQMLLHQLRNRLEEHEYVPTRRASARCRLGSRSH